MFELGNCIVEKEKLGDHYITYIYDFWKNPDEIVEVLNEAESDLYWKLQNLNSDEREFIKSKMTNGIFFEDRRHTLQFDELKQAHHFLSSLIEIPHNICKSSGYGQLMTNVHKIYDSPFNDFQNNWWFPHKDKGYPYTCLWYFNKNDNVNGTNLYEQVEAIDYVDSPSHFVNEVIYPWVPKKFFNRIKLLKPIYNSAVIFPGGDYFHGMNVEDNRYSNNYRLNSVLFISEE